MRNEREILCFFFQLAKRSGQSINELLNMDEKQLNVFKQIGPIVDNVNYLLNRVQRLDDQNSDPDSEKIVSFLLSIVSFSRHSFEDPLAKITNIFCGEVEKNSNPQRQVMNDDDETTSRSTKTSPKTTTTSTSTASTVQQRLIDSIDQGEEEKNVFFFFVEQKIFDFLFRQTIESIVRIFVEVLNKAANMVTSLGH